MNKKLFLIILLGIFFLVFLAYFTAPAGTDSDTNSTNAWLMFHRTLNHTAWDGNDFTIIPNLNQNYFTTRTTANHESSPAIVNGNVYVGSYDFDLYQLNASNVSQKIANFSSGGYISSSPVVVNGFVYVGSNSKQFFQLNASNVSQKIANYTTVNASTSTQPVVWNGFVYVGVAGTTYQFSQLYQLNASNVSKKIANHSNGAAVLSTPAIANGFLYYGSGNQVYQVNASNISKRINTFTSAVFQTSPAVWNNYVYIADNIGKIYQLNATNISKPNINYTSEGCYWDDYGDAGDTIYYSSPAIANGRLYIGTSCGYLFMLNASNVSQKIARYDLPLPPAGGYTYSNIYSSPLVANGYVYLAAGSGSGGTGEPGIIYQLNATTLQHFANFTNSSVNFQYASPSYANGYIYFAGGSRIYQLNATNVSLGNPSASSCEYSGSGNWDITCSHNCTWESNTTISGNITMTGNGTLTLNKHFIFSGTGRYVFLNRGCQFNINRGGGFS